MKKNVRPSWHFFAIIMISFIHLSWLIITIKWTYSGYFFISYSTLLIFAFLLVKVMKMNLSAVIFIIIGVFSGLFASIAAWFISNAMFAPYRFEYFINSPRSIWDFGKISLFMSTITGGWIVGGVQGYIFHHWQKYLERKIPGT